MASAVPFRAWRPPVAGRTLAKYLLTRGLWLIALELTIVSLGFNFAPLLFLQVIWAIGFGMIVLSALIWLPSRTVLIIGAGHGALAPIDATNLGAAATAWRVLMEPGLIGPGPGFVPYPAIPWLGVLCLGYGLAPVFLAEPQRRRRLFVGLGACATAAFIILRAINVYADPVPWTSQPDAGRTNA
jgi:uncharacterized membrane protein